MLDVIEKLFIEQCIKCNGWAGPSILEEKNGKILDTPCRQCLDRRFVGEIKIENSILTNQITIKSKSIVVTKEPEMFERMGLGFRFLCVQTSSPKA